MATRTTQQRPPVEMTVARHLSTDQVIPVGSDEWARVRRHLDFHGVASPHEVVYLCLACGSVGMAESQAARDGMANHFDWTCHDGYTVYFRTEKV